MDPYKVLGIDIWTSFEDAKSHYRDLIKQHHPDKGGDKKRFIQIQEAWEKIEKIQNKEMPRIETTVTIIKHKKRHLYYCKTIRAKYYWAHIAKLKGLRLVTFAEGVEGHSSYLRIGNLHDEDMLFSVPYKTTGKGIFEMDASKRMKDYYSFLVGDNVIEQNVNAIVLCTDYPMFKGYLENWVVTRRNK